MPETIIANIMLLLSSLIYWLAIGILVKVSVIGVYDICGGEGGTWMEGGEMQVQMLVKLRFSLLGGMGAF